MIQRRFTSLVLLVVIFAILGSLGYMFLFKKPLARDASKELPETLHQPAPSTSTEPTSPTVTPSQPTTQLVTSSSPSITLLSPNGGERLIEGNIYTISWKSDHPSADSYVWLHLISSTTEMKLERYLINDAYLLPNQPRTPLGQAAFPPTGSFPWIARMPEGPSEYKIRAILLPRESYAWVKDASDGWFRIEPSSSTSSRSLKVLAPNGGERLQAGQAYRIRWDSTGIAANTKIVLRAIAQESNYFLNPSGGAPYHTATIGTTTNTGSFDWTVPEFVSTYLQCPSEAIPISADIRLEIYAVDDYWESTFWARQASDTSDVPFEVSGPCKREWLG